jgi:hypothetical protein
MAFTTAYYMPNQAQFFMWCSLGIMFAYWDRADYKAPVVAGMKKMFGARRSGVWGSQPSLGSGANIRKGSSS